MTGVDLSHYQQGLRLPLLKDGGFGFAILKISEGSTIPDPSFDSFYSAAGDAGFPVGAYVYSHAVSAKQAETEAEYALRLLKGRALPLGIFMDVETPAQMSLPRDQLRQTILAFCRAIGKAGYASGIYGSEYNLWQRVDPDDFGDSLIWTAHYGRRPEMRCDLWQKTDEGQIPGYSGPVDLDETCSDKMRALIGQKQEPAPYFPPDLSVMMLQTILCGNGYNVPITGYKSAEFFSVLREFVDDMEVC